MRVINRPEHPVFISLDRTFVYRELDELSDRFANVLIEKGIHKGDRVAFYLPNCLQALITFFGVSKAAATVVTCNVMLKKDELAYQLADSGSKAIVTLHKLYPIVESIRDQTSLDHIFVTNIRDYAEPSAWVPPIFERSNGEKMTKPPSEAFDFASVIERASPESPNIQEINIRKDLISIIYTSGTTGKAKGVMLSHYNYLADCVTISCRGDWREDDVSLFLFPIFHVGSQGLVLFPSIFMGMTMVNVPKFDSEVVLDLIEKYKVSLMHMPPTAYTGLLSHPKSSSFDLSSLRYCSAGGAPLPPATVEEWKKRTGIRILDAYGLTETTCGVPLHETKVKNKMGAAGTAGSEIKIVDPEGKTVPIGTTGEILVRGTWVALGYWNKPEESENTFTKDGWLHTGDAGYMDEDEFVYVVDRYKDLIVTSGYNVAPAEVEKLILTHGAVQEVCVYGISDSYRGEAVKASIVLKEDFKGKIGQQEIIEFCREKSAVYKTPRFVEFVDEIPKTSSGKMLRRLLKGKE